MADEQSIVSANKNIAGESLMGIFVAILIGANLGFPKVIFKNKGISIAIFLAMIIVFYRLTMKHFSEKL